jgi:hypothetical protein
LRSPVKGKFFKLKWYPALLLLCQFFNVSAEQTLFKKSVKDDQTHFKYRWLDHKNQSRELSFNLSNKSLFNRFRNFKGYQPERVKRTILVKLQQAAAKLDRRKINANFIDRADGIEIQLHSTDQDLIDRTLKGLTAIREKTEAELLKKYYYNVLTDKLGLSGVKPDHVRFVQESHKDIQPVTSAILKANPNLRGRQLAEYVLAFVQSIPYSTLESRRESHGAGFSPPLRLLNNNQGDCDSKVTLMANILNVIYPGIKIIIIYLPKHALIGIQMPHRKKDKYINVEGRDFILAEPTGPAMMPLATIAESSEIFIDGKQFTYEMF